MTDQNKWEIEQLKEQAKERAQKTSERFRKVEEKIEDLVLFKTSTVEKLIIVFQMLEELKEGDKYIKRVFITSLVAAAVSGVGSLIVWAFQN